VTKEPPTREAIEALRAKGMKWTDVSAALGYKSRDAARMRYRHLVQGNALPEKEQAAACYAYLKSRNPCLVTWHELSRETGISRQRALAILGYTRSQWRTANQPDQPPPPPPWRDNGLGESIAYQRALERVERYVAAGDERSAAINQAYMETGVKVR
jgi:hypothetical protein